MQKTILFVCFILRFGFPLCPRPHGPIGTPLLPYELSKGACSWVCWANRMWFSWASTHGLTNRNTDNSHGFTIFICGCSIAQSYNRSVTPLEISDCKVAWFVTSYRTRTPHRTNYNSFGSPRPLLVQSGCNQFYSSFIDGAASISQNLGASTVDDFFNDPLRIAGLQRMLRRQGTRLCDETTVQLYYA